MGSPPLTPYPCCLSGTRQGFPMHCLQRRQPAPRLARLSDRLGIPVGELRGYGGREQARTGHLRDIAAYLGWR
jgi:hypothetical protein